jgi:3-oxoacyl-[acyl-carrier protein] reductase
MIELAGRTAVVTGGAQGIGEGIAKGLWSCGAAVVIADINAEGAVATAASIDRSRTRSLGCALDVRERTGFERLLDVAIDRFGRVDILVNNAARNEPKPIWDIGVDEWNDILDVNLRGAFFGCQVIGTHLRDSGYGRIINIASSAGQMASRFRAAHYAASKGGLIALTRVAAADFAGYGVTVNAIAPGPTRTTAMDETRLRRVDELAEHDIPIGRAGTAGEIGALAAFLASEHAGHITGATYDINGGLLMR